MMNRLLITGAAGALGSMCRARLTPLARTLRLSDMADLGEAAPHEELVRCDLGDAAAVDALVQGCDGIVHFGGRASEDTWQVIRNANIDGMVNLYEAARKHGKPRIFYASSNHTIGYYPQTQHIDATAPTRPDGLYGLSKVFGEQLARLYFDKFGVETACVRIGSCFPEPRNHRMLATWLSYGDLVRLVERVFAVPRLGCPVIFGASANDARWWDNRHAAYLGWVPQDSAEPYRAAIDAATPRPAPDAPDALFQGGMFTAEPIHEG